MVTAKTPTPSSAKVSPTPSANSTVPQADPSRAKALEQYEIAVRLLHEGKYDKAHVAFNKVLAISPPDFADRIRMYLDTCVKQSTKDKHSFATPEEQYDYAISLLNDGHYEDAREQLTQIVKAHNEADYAFYGLAVLASMTGDAHKCLDHLTESIRLNTLNRIQARSDSDFQDMADDPRFTELLYPEA
jgi:tetratricopeptide (TPR) repeat protein